VQDASYERRTALVKYITTQREVDHPTTLVRPAHGNVVAQETQNGGVWILERVERALYTGRMDVITEAWDGLDQQIRSDPSAANTSIIDLRGGILTRTTSRTPPTASSRTMASRPTSTLREGAELDGQGVLPARAVQHAGAGRRHRRYERQQGQDPGRPDQPEGEHLPPLG